MVISQQQCIQYEQINVTDYECSSNFQFPMRSRAAMLPRRLKVAYGPISHSQKNTSYN